MNKEQSEHGQQMVIPQEIVELIGRQSIQIEFLTKQVEFQAKQLKNNKEKKDEKS